MHAQIVESAGIGLVFGLRYYGNGVLKENELVIYVQVKTAVADCNNDSISRSGNQPFVAAPRSALGVLQEGHGARAAGAEARPGRPLQGTGVPVLDQRVSRWTF